LGLLTQITGNWIAQADLVGQLKSIDLKGVVPKLAAWCRVRNGCAHWYDIRDKKRRLMAK
jgi:hypothetical protein